MTREILQSDLANGTLLCPHPTAPSGEVGKEHLLNFSHVIHGSSS